MEIPPVETELFHWDRRMDVRIMTKLTVVFRNFANTPRKPKTVGALGCKTGRAGTTWNTESPDGVQLSHQSQ